LAALASFFNGIYSADRVVFGLHLLTVLTLDNMAVNPTRPVLFHAQLYIFLAFVVMLPASLVVFRAVVARCPHRAAVRSAPTISLLSENRDLAGEALQGLVCETFRRLFKLAA
jgi:hypothetical protein